MTKKRISYTKEQLFSESLSQDNAVIKELIDLRVKGKVLTQLESDFACAALEIAHKEDGTKVSFDFCDNYRFKILLLKYFDDVTGQLDVKDEYDNIIPPSQRNVDALELERYYTEWLSVINNERHKDETLRECANEGREQLRELRKSFKNDLNPNGTVRRSDLYIKAEKKVVLYNRFIYLHTLGKFDYWNEEDFVFNIDGYKIEYTRYSHIHIFTRHFGEVLAGYKTGKIFHGMDVVPDKVNLMLKYIVEKSHFGSSNDHIKVCAKFKGIEYTIYIKKKPKHMDQSIPYRVETFYRTTDPQELNSLNNYSERRIDNDLTIFVG